MVKKKNLDPFFAMLRAGLWEQGVRLLSFEPIDYDMLYRLAEEQSVLGLIAAGFEHVEDKKIEKKDVVQFIGKAIYLEKKNSAMNGFIGSIVDKMREAGIDSILVKGQGIAQCYARPLWRSPGDVDLLLDIENYNTAKSFLTPLASSLNEEDVKVSHLGMTIDSWMVEIHGTLRSGLGRRIDNAIDAIQDGSFREHRFRTWRNGDIDVLLPAVDDDVIFVFSHILQHFFKGGIGLRQICDWCRLLWSYRGTLDEDLLAKRLRNMGLMSEWRAFAALSVDKLGMPKDAVPLYSSCWLWRKKGNQVMSFVLETGNFGHNRDKSYYEKYPFIVYKTISFWKNTMDSLRHFIIFPKDATRIWFIRLIDGVKVAAKGRKRSYN